MARKHVAQRTCIGCRQVRPKRNMVRIVRTPSGEVTVDGTGKEPGRGAYLCPDRECWETALSRGSISRALRTKLTQEERAALRRHIPAPDDQHD